MKKQIKCTIKGYEKGTWTMVTQSLLTNNVSYKNPNYTYLLVFTSIKYTNYLRAGQIIEL